MKLKQRRHQVNRTFCDVLGRTPLLNKDATEFLVRVRRADRKPILRLVVVTSAECLRFGTMGAIVRATLLQKQALRTL